MIAPARQVAYRILLQMAVSDDAHSDDLLHSAAADALSAQDRALVTTLVLGTLRWQLALDARIRPLLARPGAPLSPEAAIALRMGAYQLLYLDRVPAHAVLHDSVELIKPTPQVAAAGMVNAVLRKIQATERGAQSSEHRAQGSEPDPSARASAGEEIARAWAHPTWMVERWTRRYGPAAAAAICRWDQEPAAAALRLADPGADLAGLETEPGAFLALARRLTRGDPRAALGDRRVRIQDEASQLVAELAAAAAPHAARVLDACAAPGGKTAILAERLPDAQITAADISRKRLDAMRALLPDAVRDRLQFVAADAATAQPAPVHDLILCDAPCSGTGTLARNPEIKLRLAEGDLRRQHARQAAIVRSSLRGLAPGGRLVYSTCSLEPEENEAVIEEVLREVPGVSLIPAPSLLDRLEDSGVLAQGARTRLETAIEGPFLRTLPGVHPCDGFFAAVLAAGGAD